MKVDSKPTDYQEGPWFYKRNKHYYMAYASTCCSEGLGYAMSDRPTGPWVHKGKIMDPNQGSTGNHPGIIDYQGASYLFGFNYRLNFAITPIHHERRSITLTRFSYNPDGTIPNQPWWDDKGVEQLQPLDPFWRVEAETIAWTSRIKRDRDRPYDWAPGVTTAGDAQTGVYVTRTSDRTYIKIAGVDFGKAGASSFVASVAKARPGSRIELRVDRLDGPVIGTLQLDGAASGKEWRELSAPVSGATGTRDLYLLFKGGWEPSLVDFDYWRFVRAPASSNSGGAS
jgi:hypothetical protein